MTTQFAINKDALFWAEEQDFPGCKCNHAYVLQTLAWCADASGHCFMTRAELAGKTGLNDQTVRRKLRDLEAARLISIAPDRFVLRMFDEAPRPKRPTYLRLVT